MRVAVVGAGGWGTTLADLLTRNDHEVSLWAREPEVVDSVRKQRVNRLFLPGCELAKGLEIHGDIATAVRGALVVVMVPPSHAMRQLTEEVGRALDGHFDVDIPLYSSRPFLFRGVLPGPNLEAKIANWQTGQFAIQTGAGFPDAKEVWVRRADHFQQLTRSERFWNAPASECTRARSNILRPSGVRA